MPDDHAEIPLPDSGGGGTDTPNTGDDDMAETASEGNNFVTALTFLANEAAAGSGRRTAAADQLASDSQRMWAVHMTTPTVLAGLGFQTAIGGGKTSPGKGAAE